MSEKIYNFIRNFFCIEMIYLKNLTAICLVLLLTACGSVPITGRKQLTLVSDQEVLSLSNQSFTDYMKTAKVSSNTAKTQQVQRVGNKIAKAVESYLRNNGMESAVSQMKWQFVLVSDQTPNAFALPGGKVVVNEGILPYTQTDDGLAVVIGHEIAHAVAKHSNERLSQQMLLQYGGTALDALMQNKTAASRQLASSVYGLGAQVGVMLPFSRKQEYEADHLGLIFMAIAGYDVYAAPKFWTKMSSLTTEGGGTPEFMSTHPSDANRIKQINSIIPEALKYKK